MKTLQDIKGRCRVDECGHWIWAGARSGKHPNVYAQDYTRGGMANQNGHRAVWHIKSQKPIPPGWRAYSTCQVEGCLNPAHIGCAPVAEIGKFWRESGSRKGNINHMLANRKINTARSALTPELVLEIQLSSESGVALAKRLKVSRTTISKARLGVAAAAGPMGGMFSGLIAANGGKGRARA